VEKIIRSIDLRQHFGKLGETGRPRRLSSSGFAPQLPAAQTNGYRFCFSQGRRGLAHLAKRTRRPLVQPRRFEWWSATLKRVGPVHEPTNHAAARYWRISTMTVLPDRRPSCMARSPTLARFQLKRPNDQTSVVRWRDPFVYGHTRRSSMLFRTTSTHLPLG
jgi:hypothetical protein